MRIKSIKYLKDYELRFTFENGHIRDIDFEPFLRLHIDHPMINPYLKIEAFKKYKNKKYCISWKNDMTFSTESLYNSDWSEEYVQRVIDDDLKFAIEHGFLQGKNKKSKKYLVAFIDILGFSKMIDDYYKGKDLSSFPKLKNALNIAKQVSITYTQQYLKQHNLSFSFKQFSDCISISIPIDKRADESIIAVFGILQSIVRLYYMILLTDGILLRGGISIGGHKEDNNIIFSEALVKAYKIEKDKAVTPRILIDSEIIELLKDEFTSQKEEIAIFNELYGKTIIKDWDNEFFISPFNLIENYKSIGKEGALFLVKDFMKSINAQTEVTEEEIEEIFNSDFDKEFVTTTIKLIDDFITKHKDTEHPSVISKYKWLKEFALWNLDNEKSSVKFEIFKLKAD